MVEPGAASPGIGLARALRADPGPLERVVGLATETDAARLRNADLGLWTLAASPDPAQGEPFLERLREVQARTPLELLLAARGADVTALVPLTDELSRMGIRTFLPTAAQLALLRGAARPGAGENGAVRTYVVAAVGDGAGGVAAAAALRRVAPLKESQPWVGVAAQDAGLLDAVRAFFAITSLRGAAELEVTRDGSGVYRVARAEPRLPAWVQLFASYGPNLPAVMARLALGQGVKPTAELPGGPLLVGAAWESWMSGG
jgi:hypothetical protein